MSHAFAGVVDDVVLGVVKEALELDSNIFFFVLPHINASFRRMLKYALKPFIRPCPATKFAAHALEKGHTDLFAWLVRHGCPTIPRQLGKAAAIAGNIDFLRGYEGALLPLWGAAGNAGQDRTLRWLKSLPLTDPPPKDVIQNSLAEGGKINVWKVLETELALQPSLGAMNSAATKVHREMFNFLFNKAKTTAEFCQVPSNTPVLFHKAKNEIAGMLAFNGWFEELKEFLTIKFLDDMLVIARRATSGGHLDIVKWAFETHDIAKSSILLALSARDTSLHILHYLTTVQGMRANDPLSPITAVMSNAPKALALLLPEVPAGQVQRLVRFAITNNAVDCLELLEKTHKISQHLPEEPISKSAVLSAQLLDWLYRHNVPLESIGERMFIVANSDIPTIQWALEHELFVDKWPSVAQIAATGLTELVFAAMAKITLRSTWEAALDEALRKGHADLVRLLKRKLRYEDTLCVQQ